MHYRICALVIVFGGCGGGGGGGTHFSTTVSGSTPVASLSPAQQTQICSEAQSFATSILVDVCKVEGFVAAATLSLSNGTATNAQLQAQCSSSTTTCVDGGNTGQCDFSSFQTGTCTATVAQLSACLNDVGALEDQTAAKVPSCGSLTIQNVNATLTTLQQDGGASTEPASCVAFDNACPGQTVTGTMITKM
jgi:hypothetical protein